MRTRRPIPSAALSIAAVLALSGLAGCSDDDPSVNQTGAEGAPVATATSASAGSAAGTGSASTAVASGETAEAGPVTEVAVAASDTGCSLTPASVPAGATEFVITSSGTVPTEVYVLNAEGLTAAERAGITPGSTQELLVKLGEGPHTISCRPEGKPPVDTALTVTPGASTALSAEEQTAVTAYRAYVTAQVADTVAGTEHLVKAIKEGDLAEAKELYAPSRFGWESIEPVAEAFGDIDPKVDLREADLEPGQVWTGWHKIEKSLFADGKTTGMGVVGDQLLADLDVLVTKIPDAEITPTGMANGAKELLDEVASGKITGEEEAFSHTDLVDFKANLDGARRVFELLRPIAEKNDAALVATLATEFDDADAALQPYESGDGYVSYDTVTEAQRKTLSDVVNALGEPLSKLAAAVVS